MHSVIQFQNSSEQKHHQPAKEFSIQQKHQKTKPRESTNQGSNQQHTTSKNIKNLYLQPTKATKLQKKAYKNKRKNPQYNKKRNTTINQQPGTNTLNIASLNPDFFTTNAIQQDIINQLTQQKYTSPPYKKLTYRAITPSQNTTTK